MKPFLVAALVLSCPLAAQGVPQDPPAQAPETESRKAPDGVVRKIDFAGLRRFSAEALRAQISLHEGDVLDAAKLERDVRALDALGWFESVSVQVETLPVLLAWVESCRERCGIAPSDHLFSGFRSPVDSTGVQTPDPAPWLTSLSQQAPVLRVTFVVEEWPFLAGYEFRGSRRLTTDRISELLGSRGVLPRIATPANPTGLRRAARAIEAELAEMGHGRARVAVQLQQVPTESVRAVFRIEEGPRIEVSRVQFTGNQRFSEQVLRKEMDRVAPHALFAAWRDKNIFTEARLGEDRARLEQFYRDHGFPEARIGTPQVDVVQERVRSWFPWPRQRTLPKFHVSIPVVEGVLFQIESIRFEGYGLDSDTGWPKGVPRFAPLEPYSEAKLERLRNALSPVSGVRWTPPESRHRTRSPLLSRPAPGTPATDARPTESDSLPPQVEVLPQFNREKGTVRVILRSRTPEAYVVRRIEFTGHHMFSDAFYRRRVGLREGEPFDTEKLEKGLAKLAGSGYIKPIKPEHIDVRVEEEKKLVDITVRIEEIGRQRISLLGGGSRMGSTAGVAYNVFSLFGGEELLAGYIEGGPEILTVATSLAREGMFGTQLSFGLAVYRTVVAPRLPGSRSQRLFTSRSSGWSQSWSYPLTPQDTLAMGYQSASTQTQVTPGQTASQQAGTNSTRHAVSAAWTHYTGRQRLSAAQSVSGGVLGGSDDVLRSTVEYAALAADPLSDARNTWAVRGYASGVSSFTDDELPLHERIFAGDELVRGLQAGDLVPPDAAGATLPGATLVAAANVEYRLAFNRKLPGTQAALFLDTGAGWRMPRWLGGTRESESSGGRSVWRGTSGAEFRWVVPQRFLGLAMPLAGETLRIHFAFEPARGAGRFGWGMGPRF